MTPSPARPRKNSDIMAAEHAMGVTGVGERAEAEWRRATDPTFDSAVAHAARSYDPID